MDSEKVVIVYKDGSTQLTTFEVVAEFESTYGPGLFSVRPPTADEIAFQDPWIPHRQWPKAFGRRVPDRPMC